jgi:N-acetylmuramoyl-L-alanine amidase
MRVKNYKLVGHWHRQSRDIGGELESPRFIVMHYTAGGSGAGSRDYMLKSPKQKQLLLKAPRKVYGSAHVVVDRDASVWQIVPFNVMARHAGRSHWKGFDSLNRYSIGIEIANYGWLDKQGDGSYKRSDTPRFEAGDVTVAPMPGGTAHKGWENYPDVQLEAVEQVTRALLASYPSIVEVVGHQDISPGRKFDPGPAFPIEYFANLADSRGVGAVEDEPDIHEPPPQHLVTTTRLNIRGGPGVGYEKLDESPLAANTEEVPASATRSWMRVRWLPTPNSSSWTRKGSGLR